jgi:SnoaL-like protein
MNDQPGNAPNLLRSVERGFELFNSGNLEILFAEIFHPSISYRGDPDISALAGFQADAEGVDGVRAVWEGFFAMFDEVQLTDVELTARDERTVLGRCHMVTRGGVSGTPIDAPFSFAWVLEEDRWVFMAAKLDPDEVLASLQEWEAVRGSAAPDADQSSQA